MILFSQWQLLVGYAEQSLSPLVQIDANFCIISSFQVLYTKLFLILGILWIIESVHFIIHNHYGQPCQEYSFIGVFFRIIDSFNMLRGFFLFIIFILKKNVWKKIKSFANKMKQKDNRDNFIITDTFMLNDIKWNIQAWKSKYMKEFYCFACRALF